MDYGFTTNCAVFIEFFVVYTVHWSHTLTHSHTNVHKHTDTHTNTYVHIYVRVGSQAHTHTLYTIYS